jgi:NTE family protein
MALGLVMGGGGIVGIAWETGVLAGLREACGFDPGSAAVIMGSSAGSVIGAQAACDRDLDELVALQRRPPNPTTGSRPMPDFSTGPRAEIMQLLMSGGGDENAARLGALAMECETALDEATYVESFRSMIGTDDWPAVDLRITTCECETGRGVAWSRTDGIDLVRAVASSCAVPGFFPTVAFGDRHYTDGPRGQGMTVDIVTGANVDVALFVGPNVALGQFAHLMDAEFEAIRAKGIELHTITGGPELAALGSNLMDASLRPAAVEAGLADGRAAAATLGSVLAASGSVR